MFILRENMRVLEQIFYFDPNSYKISLAHLKCRQTWFFIVFKNCNVTRICFIPGSLCSNQCCSLPWLNWFYITEKISRIFNSTSLPYVFILWIYPFWFWKSRSFVCILKSYNWIPRQRSYLSVWVVSDVFQ